MVYEIKVKYQTGNSFGSEDAEDTVGYVWRNLDVAKAALKCIREHYELVCEGSTWSEEQDDKAKKYPWYSRSWPVTLSIPTDEGTRSNISAFWCGYFETLYSAEIIMTGDDDLRYEP